MRRISLVLLSVVLFTVGCAAPRSAFTVALKVPVKETQFTETGMAMLEYKVEPTFRR